MGFIHNQASPLDRAETSLVHADHLVGGEKDVELHVGGPELGGLGPATDGALLERQLVLPNHDARLAVAHVRNHVEVGRPDLELALPVDDGGEGDRDDEGSLRVALLVQRVEEDDRLDGFPQAHLVRQDGVCSLAPGVPRKSHF